MIVRPTKLLPKDHDMSYGIQPENVRLTVILPQNSGVTLNQAQGLCALYVSVDERLYWNAKRDGVAIGRIDVL